MYLPLYNENIGLGGFKCNDCGRVTRTESGMRSHLWRVHGKKAQLELFEDTADKLIRRRGAYAIVLYRGTNGRGHRADCASNIGLGTLPCTCGTDSLPEVRRESNEEL